jgi:DNA-binding response OmpR family regulator
MAKRVCVIEDDELQRQALALTLREAGYEVFEADDGEGGIDLVRREKPDVVITDILMPKTEGIETIQKIRAISPDIRIVAISGGGRVSLELNLNLARQFGAHVCLSKPIAPGKLCAAIEGS